MGFFKKVKKAVKKAVKKVTKPIEKVAKGAVGAVTGGGGAQVVEVPTQQAAPAAQLVDVPTQDVVSAEDEAQTEAGRKKARAGGKKSLSVARSSGGGLNI